MNEEIIKWEIQELENGRINLYCFVNSGTPYEMSFIDANIKLEDIDEAKQGMLRKLEIEFDSKN